MPHLVILYTSNLENKIDFDPMCRELADTMLAQRDEGGEDVADLGGTLLAQMAWKKATKGQNLEPIDGLTPDERFFIGYAQWACENDRPEPD